VAETHWGRKLNSPWRAHLLARRVEPEKSIKGLSFTSGGRIGLSYHTIVLEVALGEKHGKNQRDSKEQGSQGLKEDTRLVRHHDLVPLHLFFSSCKVTMTMSN